MDFKEQLRAQVDIVRVASDYVRLRRVGNRYAGLCPFHNEKTPSFSIYAEHQFFKCFGCDAKGDVFNFVMMIEGLTFWEALRKLADQHGIALPNNPSPATKTRASGPLSSRCTRSRWSTSAPISAPPPPLPCATM